MSSEAITQLLGAARAGDGDAANALVPLIYQELRRMAARRLAAMGRGHTLQPTALVHEIYVELVAGGAGGPDSPDWSSRAHFFGAAARAMRELLVDHARRKRAAKRGGGAEHAGGDELDEVAGQLEMPREDMIALDRALEGLEKENARAAQVVQLNYFVGLTHAEIAELLKINERTVERDWRLARAWLHRSLNP